MSTFTKALDGPWWGAGTLRRDVHGPLIANRAAIARRAGLGPANMSAIWDPLPASVTAQERGWLRDVIKRHPAPNLQYSGSLTIVRDQFVAMVGALLRNWTDARLLSVDEIVDMVLNGEGVEARVLFIPDFVVSGEGAGRNDRSRGAVTTMMRKRLLNHEVTVLYVGAAKERPYGPVLHTEISETFAPKDMS